VLDIFSKLFIFRQFTLREKRQANKGDECE